jgi:hypothetical protein
VHPRTGTDLHPGGPEVVAFSSPANRAHGRARENMGFPVAGLWDSPGQTAKPPGAAAGGKNPLLMASRNGFPFASAQSASATVNFR